MRKFEVKVGTQIDKLDGHFIVTSINEAGLCFCDEFTFGEGDDDDPVKEDREARLTKHDIARYLKEVDGLNHDVIIERGTV